ncbi:hypothetical protein AEGHOMDF_5430 [Methylobacterium soli]|nr:hypothetical protein AEGHOMDF_5430 [Methylobacterium soli]
MGGQGGPEVAQLLTLGARGAGMIVACFCPTTDLMRRPHVLKGVGPAEFEGADMLNDPALTDPVDALVADDTGAARALPGL